MDHILSPVDGSESSFRALEVAAKLAKRLGAKHTVLAVRQYVVGRKTLAEVWSDSDLKDIFKKAKEIVAAALRFVGDGDVIAVGPGATTYTFVKRLASSNVNITVFTNNLAAVTCFAGGSWTRVVVAPGDYDVGEGCTVGPETIAFISKFRFDTMFFSLGGLTSEGGSDSVSGLAWSERSMLERSARHILLVDHTKFDNAFFELVCPLTSIQILITDKSPTGVLLEALQKAKVEVIVAPSSYGAVD